MKWKTMETAPKDGTAILGCNSRYGDDVFGLGAHPRTVHWNEFHPNAKGKPCWRNAQGHKELHLTHWMPMLPAPKNEEKS